jgi:anti-anti-sigma regulatory factor
MMATIVPMLRVDGERIAQSIEEVREKLDGADHQLVLDFSAVGRLNPGAVTAMKTLAGTAEGKTVRVVLHGVNVNAYKVLKLADLAKRFSFAT